MALELKTKEIEIDGEKFVIKQLSVKGGMVLADLSKSGKQSDIISKALTLGIVEPKVTEIMLEKQMNLKIGLKLVKEIQDFSGLSTDFLSQTSGGN